MKSKTFNIRHRPIFDTEKVSQFYSEKDGVEVKYICTSSVSEHGAVASDIYYRETPHPEFGNKYFGLYRDHEGKIMITNADKIESLTFEMVDNSGELYYSQDRHDFYTMPNGVAIDGGRSYLRLLGDGLRSLKVEKLKIKNGTFVEV